MATKKFNEEILIFITYAKSVCTQIRINHLETKLLSEHLGIDRLEPKLHDLCDSIGESVFGRLGRPNITTQDITISDLKIVSTEFILDELLSKIEPLYNSAQDKKYTEICSLFDDMKNAIYQTKYFLSLR